MGTTVYNDYGSTWDEMVRYELTGSKTGEGDRYRVLAKSGRYYAVERIEEGIVTAVVALGQKYRDGDISVKLVDENMGPYERKAPAKILDLLSPTDSEYALEWRAACRANLAAKKTAAKLTKGTRFRVEKPVEFVNGASASEFVYWGRYEASALTDDGRRFAVSLPKTWRTDWKWTVIE